MTLRPHLVALPLFAWALAACGARTELRDPPAPPPATDAATCHLPAPTCVAPDADDPCGPPHTVAAVCDASLAWRCPGGARFYERAVADPPVCLPFVEAGGPLRSLGGALVRVPTDDGRCLWVGEDVGLSSGAQLRNVGFEVDPTAPFATCPTHAVFAGGAAQSLVTLASDDPALVVQITGGYRLHGVSRITYRLFRADGGPAYGLTPLGTGLARWDAGSRRIMVPGPAALRFRADVDLGDASLVTGDRAYVWGCPGPVMFLTDRCVVARFDDGDGAELFTGAGRWLANPPPASDATVFDAGPWISSVAPMPGGTSLAHVFAVGFGTELEAHLASAPEGPWSAATTLARCDVPATDPHSYCAGPTVHRELSDPLRPGEFAVSYGLGTTDNPARDRVPETSYWSRLQWARVP